MTESKTCILINCGYQQLYGQSGTTKRPVALSVKIFFSTLGIKEKGGKA